MTMTIKRKKKLDQIVAGVVALSQPVSVRKKMSWTRTRTKRMVTSLRSTRMMKWRKKSLHVRLGVVARKLMMTMTKRKKLRSAGPQGVLLMAVPRAHVAQHVEAGSN